MEAGRAVDAQRRRSGNDSPHSVAFVGRPAARRRLFRAPVGPEHGDRPVRPDVDHRHWDS